MPETFSALAVLAVALLPGALYTWAFERQAGRWGIGLSDRVLRFVGGSAIFQAAFAPLTYWLWSEQWPKLRQGQSVALTMWFVPLAYVALPVLGGTVIGMGTRSGAAWARWFTGPNPAPTAWEYLFQQNEADGWIRLRMKSGTWLGGAYALANGKRSYTAGYPEAQDLYLAAVVRVDPDSGEFVLDDDGEVDVLPSGLLVRWDEVEYLEFIDA